MADRRVELVVGQRGAADLRWDIMALSARWLLTQRELRLILGLGSRSTGEWLPSGLVGDARHRARLLLDVARYLERLIADERAIVGWVHSSATAAGRSVIDLLADQDALAMLHQLLGLCVVRRFEREIRV